MESRLRRLTRPSSLPFREHRLGSFINPGKRGRRHRAPISSVRPGRDRKVRDHQSRIPDGGLVPLSGLIMSRQTPLDRSIYHKNLMPVVYVVGEVAGAKESRSMPSLTCAAGSAPFPS